MPILRVHAKQGHVDTEATDALVLLLCEGEGLPKEDGAILDRALGGALRDLLQSKEFDGKAGEVVLFHTQGKFRQSGCFLSGWERKRIWAWISSDRRWACRQTCSSSQSRYLCGGAAEQRAPWGVADRRWPNLDRRGNSRKLSIHGLSQRRPDG